MEPALVSSAQWQALSQVLLALMLFVGLAVNAAFAFLTGHALIPSLLHSSDAPPAARLVRWAMYPIFLASLALAALALERGLAGALTFLNDFFPRFEF